MRQDLCAVAIVGKESRPGLSKTRLVPPLTPDEAAALNSCFLRDMAGKIVQAAGLAPIQGYISYYPASAGSFFRKLLPEVIELLPPREAGLGPTLRHCCRDLLGLGHGAVCVINSDSPTLPSAYIAQAAIALARPGDRVVLGPSADGGYYLVGVKQVHDELFENIAWSTERVLRQTVERAGEIGLEVELLPEWYDVDDATSLARLSGDLSRRTGYAPNSGTFLRQLAARAAKRSDLMHSLAALA